VFAAYLYLKVCLAKFVSIIQKCLHGIIAIENLASIKQESRTMNNVLIACILIKRSISKLDTSWWVNWWCHGSVFGLSYLLINFPICPITLNWVTIGKVIQWIIIEWGTSKLSHDEAEYWPLYSDVLPCPIAAIWLFNWNSSHFYVICRFRKSYKFEKCLLIICDWTLETANW